MGSLISKTSLLAYQFGDVTKTLIMSIIGPIFWGLCDLFFILLDIFELVFRKLAGIDKVTINGEVVEGDIVLYLIKSNIVQNIFYSVLALSLFLLIIFTVVAIVKNQYVDKPKPVMNIISDSFKGLLMYLLVPIATIACLMVGNVILKGIDGATRANTSGGASDMLFMTAAYNANVLRMGSFKENRSELKNLYELGELHAIENQLSANFGIRSAEDIELLTEETGGAQIIERIATLIDQSFIDGTLTGGGNNLKWEYFTLTSYYNPIRISLLTVWVGGAFLIWAIGKMAWGVTSRLFKMTLGFAISPAFMALYPLSGGKELGSWKSDMIKNGTMAYCAVGVLNILYSILPLFMGLNIFSGIGVLWGQIVKLFLVIVAYTGASSLVGTVSGWFGTGDALKEGKDQAAAAVKGVKDVKGKIASGRKKVIGTFEGIRAGSKLAGDAGKNKFFGGLMGAYKGSGLADSFLGVDPAAVGKEKSAAKKAAEEFYKDTKTNTFNNDTNKANKALFEDIEYQDKLKKRIEAIQKRYNGGATKEEEKKILEEINAIGEGKWATKTEDAQLEKFKKNVETITAFKALVEGVGNARNNVAGINNEVANLNNALTSLGASIDASGNLDASGVSADNRGQVQDLFLQFQQRKSALADAEDVLRQATTVYNQRLAKNEDLRTFATGKGLGSAGDVGTDYRTKVADLDVELATLDNEIEEATKDIAEKRMKATKEFADNIKGVREARAEFMKTQDKS